MDIIVFTLIIFAGSLFAGFLGALTGLGGGVIIVPLLTLGLGVDIRYAIGASLVCVIATSSGSATANIKKGFSNTSIGIFLVIATTIGALIGAFLAGVTPVNILKIIFGVVLLYSAIVTFTNRHQKNITNEPNKISDRFKLNGYFPGKDGPQYYTVQKAPLGFGLMFIAGGLSGLLGIGSGAVKVLAMDQLMKIPFKVSTATSNFMIGVTAAASAGIYLQRGYIDPGLTMPIVLGVLLGSLTGSKLLLKTPTHLLKLIFSIVIFILAIEMIRNGITWNK